MSGHTASELQLIVGWLAAALDADDFAAAQRGGFADDCVYQGASETLHGARGDHRLVCRRIGVGASHLRRGALRERRSAPRTRIRCRSLSSTTCSRPAAAGTAIAAGRSSRSARDGRIARIVHHDLPGEREALAAYFKECGIERSDGRQGARGWPA